MHLEKPTGKNFRDLTGLTFGKLKVESFASQSDNKKTCKWKCRCDCGNHKIISSSNLSSNGGTKSCGGCIPRNRIDLSGKRLDRLLVISLHSIKRHRSFWNCQCDCGKTVICSSMSLRKTRSCGCLRKELASKRQLVQMVGIKCGKLLVLESAPKHPNSHLARWKCRCDCGREIVVSGAALRSGGSRSCGCTTRKHGGSRTKEYRTWKGMKARCHDPLGSGYARYGARGIIVDALWINDYPRFLAYVGKAPSPKHSLDRIDSTKGYVVGNVRWATSQEQSRNRCTTILLSHGGETKSLSEWAEIYGLTRDCLYARIAKGWDVSKAITEPSQPRSHKTAIVE